MGEGLMMEILRCPPFTRYCESLVDGLNFKKNGRKKTPTIFALP